MIQKSKMLFSKYTFLMEYLTWQNGFECKEYVSNGRNENDIYEWDTRRKPKVNFRETMSDKQIQYILKTFYHIVAIIIRSGNQINYNKCQTKIFFLIRDEYNCICSYWMFNNSKGQIHDRFFRFLMRIKKQFNEDKTQNRSI
jgi:hypothetical protein